MIAPPIFAHGPGMEVAIAIGILWLLFSYGSPVLVGWLTKRGRKVAALAVGIPTVLLTGFVALFYVMESESVFYLLFVGVVPFLLSVVTLVRAIRLRASERGISK